MMVHYAASGSVPTEQTDKPVPVRHPAEEAAWQRAIRAWSRDDGSDPEKTGMLVKRLLYASTDLIMAQDALIDEMLSALQRARPWMPVCMGVDDGLEADKAFVTEAIAKALGES